MTDRMWRHWLTSSHPIAQCWTCRECKALILAAQKAER